MVDGNNDMGRQTYDFTVPNIYFVALWVTVHLVLCLYAL